MGCVEKVTPIANALEVEEELMWDMIERMVNDRLWIYTGIGGSIFGALFIAYMRDTRIGLWVYSQFDKILDFVIDRYGWTWFDQPDDAWKKVNPKIARKIEELERRLHTLEMLGDEYHYLMHSRKDKNVK